MIFSSRTRSKNPNIGITPEATRSNSPFVSVGVKPHTHSFPTTTTTTTMASVEELPVCTGNDGTAIRSFHLKLNGVEASVCAVGASILQLSVPDYSKNNNNNDDDDDDDTKTDNVSKDDVVLGYKTAADLYNSKNPPYFAVVVGRVANRIAKGRLSTEENDEDVVQLDINNDPNHLHGGFHGFNSRVWDAEIVNVSNGTVDDNTTDSTIKGVKFTLTSPDGDQKYPGTIQVSATYTLVAAAAAASDKSAVKLCLQMDGALVGSDKSTPLSLAQHSYFNLAGHDSSNGVLDHHLVMPSKAYTPIDATLIPTRQVLAVKDDPTMSWTERRLVRDAIKQYAVAKAGLTEGQAEAHLNTQSRTGDSMAKAGPSSPNPGEPYGFDHNYVVHHDSGERKKGTLSVAGIVEHEGTKRRMTVSTDAPGVQLYTANYLDGSNATYHKNDAAYGQWQALCLETQTFPDSVMVDATKHPDFAKGKTMVLRPDSDETYSHRVEYKLESMNETKMNKIK